MGKILTGSDNVSTNSRPAARAVLSTVICEDHSPEIRIAQGSCNIYINSQPAARKDDHTECDAVIEDGSPNVFLGGGTQTVLEISPEIPDWLRQVVDVLYVVSEYERDSLHRQVMRTQGKLATFSGYNADNRLSWQRSLPGGSQNPQQAGNPPARNDSVTARDYIWNADGEVGGINDKLRGCLVFSYDRSGWLTSRTGQMYDHDHYYYDKAGNLLTDEYQSAVMDNRLPGYGRDRYRYNEWGELTERRDQQLEWNAQGQLTRVISSNSETRYQYDALGRRISKATSNLHTDRGERSRTTFVWEGFRLLQETTWQGKRTYLYDAEQPYTPVAAITGRGESQKIWYYHTDLTGTVQEVTAPDGTLVWAGYQAGFGENRGDISNSGAYFEQPLRLPGQYYDEETGLHYNLFRYYAPECGRFISQDPISIRGGLNLYRYAPNPLTHIDPLGLMDPFDLWFTQNTISDVFTQGKWAGRSVEDAIHEASVTGRLPDGLSISYEKIILPSGEEVWATLNNRTLYVAQQANVTINPVDKNGKGLNQLNKLLDGRAPTPEQPDVLIKHC